MSSHSKAGLTRTALYGLALSLFSALWGSGPVLADDTEIYQSSFAASATGRPKVLIVLDNSGSPGVLVYYRAATVAVFQPVFYE